MLVPKVGTPRTRVELAMDLRAGYQLAFGQLPTLKTLACGFAQNALEHAWGQAIWCKNYGNITANTAWKATRDHYVIRVAERLDKVNHPDKWTTIDLAFRAYESTEEGAEGYWKVIAGRYASVLPMFAAGDTDAASHRLSELNYFTAHVEDQIDKVTGKRIRGYATNMREFYAVFMNTIAAQLPPWQDPTDPAVCATPDSENELRCLVTVEGLAEQQAELALSLQNQTGELLDEERRAARQADEDAFEAQFPGGGKGTPPGESNA